MGGDKKMGAIVCPQCSNGSQPYHRIKSDDYHCPKCGNNFTKEDLTK